MTEPTARPHNPARGIMFTALAMGLFPLSDATLKWLSGDYHVLQLLFVRSLFVFLPTLFFLYYAGGLGMLRSKRKKLLVLRGMLAVGSWSIYLCAISQMPLADATAIFFSAPLIMAALSMPLLGEPVGPRRWIAIAVGFGGVVIIVDPGAGVLGGSALLVLLAATLFSFAQLAARSLSSTESSATLVFYTTTVLVLATGAVQPVVWTAMSWRDVGYVAGAGLITGIAQLCQTQSLKLAPIAIVAPFLFTQLIWATLYGYVLWGDLPSTSILVGGAVVIASGLYVLYRETRLNHRP
ncbi:MAG: DMT family transporter [Alphaproteobacteria bacterium]